MYSHLRQIKNWDTLIEMSHYSTRKLAKSCQTSVRQLERFFRETYGKTPEQRINEVRQHNGRRLLESGFYVKEVAAQLGYKQPNHFSRQFKRFYGISPTNVLATGSALWQITQTVLA